jgi:tRNA U54 and U55 pseudouridine synthase Pus10
LLDFEEVAKTIQEAMKLRFEKEAIHSTTTRDNAVLKRLSQVRSNIIAGVGQGVDITDMETFPSESSLKDATIKARTNAKVAQKADLSDTDKAKEIATDTVRTIFNHSMQSIKDSSLGDEVKAEFKKEVDAQFRALYEEVIAKADILLSPATTNTGDAAPATNEATG